jgi:hypothetical protein
MSFEHGTLEPPPDETSAARRCPPGEPVGAVELRRAVENGRASFPQLFKAYWLAERHGRRGGWGADQKCDAPYYRRLFRELLPVFERAHGPVEMSFFADGMPGAVALNRFGGTARDASLASDAHAIVWWEEVSFDAHAARTLFSALMQLRDRVTSFIPGGASRRRRDKSAQERHHLLHEIFCIACDLVASVEREQATHSVAETAGDGRDGAALGADPSARHLGEVVDLRARLAVAQANYEAASRRIGERWFLPGVRDGGLVVAALLVAFAFASQRAGWDPVWAATAAAGVAGAVVSVLQRMTTGSLAVCAEADPKMVRTVGYCRVLLGVILGVVSYVLVGGGLLALGSPDGRPRVLYFAGIAFVAGFSERFARDMLAAPTELLSGPNSPKAAPRPSAAPAG